MTLVKFNPVKTNSSLIPGFSDVFDSVFNDTFFSDKVSTRMPAVNIAETQDHYHIELAAPGLTKEDFKLTVDQNVLHISAEQTQNTENTDKQYNRREYSYQSFIRSFNLPEAADQQRIEARYDKGILQIDIAKKEEAKSIARQIDIK